jgi:hypothetical protein
MTLAQEPMVKLETTVNEVLKIRRRDNKACLEVCLAMLSPLLAFLAAARCTLGSQ